jgi:hypothetical protein
MEGCPQFMIVHFTNLPCMRPRNGQGNLVRNRPDRSLKLIGGAKTQAQND